MYVHAFKGPEVLHQMIESGYLQLLTQLVVCVLGLFSGF